MVFAFMLCWIPLWIITILTRFNVIGTMPRSVQLLCTFFLNLSNTINPFIYAGMNPLFRREFRRIICCNRGEKVDYIQQVSTTDTTQRSNTLSLRLENVVINQQPIESESNEPSMFNTTKPDEKLNKHLKTDYNDV